MTHTDDTLNILEANILVVHRDPDLQDVLSHVLENRGHNVYAARSGSAALAFLCSGRRFHAIIADWDPGRGVGQSLYDWAVERRPELCKAFIALASIDSYVRMDPSRGLCRVVHSFDLAEIVRGVQEIVTAREANATVGGDAQQTQVSASDSAEQPSVMQATVALASRPAEPDLRPSVMLVDDEPLQREILTAALDKLGFSVTSMDSREAAVRDLEREDYDVILSDWYLTDGSAAKLYAWLIANRPHLAERCVFMSARPLQEGPAQELAEVGGPRRPFVSKSGGPNALLGYVTGIAGRSRTRRSDDLSFRL
jgi:CheY-like chemotaxis protein